MVKCNLGLFVGYIMELCSHIEFPVHLLNHLKIQNNEMVSSLYSKLLKLYQLSINSNSKVHSNCTIIRDVP